MSGDGSLDSHDKTTPQAVSIMTRLKSHVAFGSVRLWALGISIAAHLIALTVLGGVHFGRRFEMRARAVSADISVHVIEQVLQEPVAPKPKPKIEPPPAPTVQRAAPEPVVPPPLLPLPEPVQTPAKTPVDTTPTDAVLFAGTATAARRVCYVIDGSGSMFGLMYLVRQQVRESSLRLTGEQAFNVLVFMQDGRLLQAFEGRLEQATPAAKAEAINLLGRIRPGGQTAAEAALETAMKMQDSNRRKPEVIYFVTDGFDLMDGGGDAFIRRIDGLRRSIAPATVVHTIGIYPYPHDRGFLTLLAKICGGRYIEVN